MGMNCGYKIPMVTLPIGLICQIISISTSYWINADLKVAHVHLGIWRRCIKVLDTETCYNWENTADWFKATQGLSVIGLALCALAVLTLFVRNCKNSGSKSLGVLTTLLAYLAGIMFLAGLAIFASKTTSIDFTISGKHIGSIDTNYLSWAWYFGLAGSALCIKAGLFLCFGVVTDRGQYTQMD